MIRHCTALHCQQLSNDKPNNPTYCPVQGTSGFMFAVSYGERTGRNDGQETRVNDKDVRRGRRGNQLKVPNKLVFVVVCCVIVATCWAYPYLYVGGTSRRFGGPVVTKLFALQHPLSLPPPPPTGQQTRAGTARRPLADPTLLYLYTHTHTGLFTAYLPCPYMPVH